MIRFIITGLAILQALTTTASAGDFDALMALPMPSGYRIESGLLERIEDDIATVEIERGPGEYEYYDYYCNDYPEIIPGDAVTVIIYDNRTADWHDDQIIAVDAD